MPRLKNAQITGEVIKYGLVMIVAITILIVGYKMVNYVQAKSCRAEISKFEIELRSLDKNSMYGSKELKSYFVPCNSDEIYFFDRSKDIDPEIFSDNPIIQNSVTSKSGNNIFLVKEGQFVGSFSGGNLEIEKPYYICFKPKQGKILFFQEGNGKSAKISIADEQPDCTQRPVEISQQESSDVIDNAAQFGTSGQCTICPQNSNTETEKTNAEKTRDNVKITRSFDLDVANRKTKVKITINAIRGSRLGQFRFYEQMPKSCIGSLQGILETEQEGDVTVNVDPDPLIVWYFNDVSRQRKISYKLNALLSGQCQQLIKGLGVAEFIGREGQH